MSVVEAEDEAEGSLTSESEPPPVRVWIASTGSWRFAVTAFTALPRGTCFQVDLSISIFISWDLTHSVSS